MYVTVEEYETYADSKGETLPTADADKTVQLTKASLFIDAQEGAFMGCRTERDQDYAFPRYGYYYNGYAYESDEIPADVLRCQMELALDINAGIDIFDREYTAQIIEESIAGAVTVKYASPSGAMAHRKNSLGLMLIQKLMNKSGGSISLIRG